MDPTMNQVKLPPSFYPTPNESFANHDLTNKIKSSVFAGSHLDPHKFMPYWFITIHSFTTSEYTH